MPSPSDQLGLSGLAEDQARQRLARQGANEIDDSERQGWLDTLRVTASEPMFLLLTVGLAVLGAIALPVTWHCWQRGEWDSGLAVGRRPGPGGQGSRCARTAAVCAACNCRSPA
tara:strand:- start:26557 stop:26898 length:342 start_codon:yes stop_codon:yes gene_type:complete